MTQIEADGDQILAGLINEYKLSVDSSTVLAVASEYDLTDPAQKAAAKNTLEFVRESVTVNMNLIDSNDKRTFEFSCENQEIDTGISSVKGSLQDCSTHTDSSSQDSTALSIDLKDLSDSMDNFKISSNESFDQAYSNALDRLNHQDKAKTLMTMFPALKAYDINHALQKYHGDIDLTIDELMMQSFLEETGDRYRSIDGFAISGHSSRRKKRKRKKDEISNSDVKELSQSFPSEVESSWDVGDLYIGFLAKRIGISKSQITDLYYETGASLPQTISHLIQNNINVGATLEDDTLTYSNALKLHKKFPNISMSQLRSLCQITHQNLVYAHDILEVLSPSTNLQIPQSNQQTVTSSLQLCNETTKSLLPKSQQPTNCTSPTSKSQISGEKRPSSLLEALDEASCLIEARNEAYAKASAAYRRGKSDHLMGAVASYYSEEARKYNPRIKKLQSEAADLLVANQSSKNRLDLHGVSVKDATRITQERVTTWWHELGESSIGNSNQEYHIITGSGLHSKNGNLKIGPAVAKMLLRGGWKIEVGSAEIIVTGVSQQRKTDKKVSR